MRAAVAVSAVLLAACSGGVAKPGTSRPAESCGTHRRSFEQGQKLPAEALRCFDEALRDRRPVSLTVTELTIEGDPVSTTYTPTPDGRVLVVHDSSQDSYSDRKVHSRICAAEPVTPALVFERDCEVADE